jgi:hypothetical protein
MIPVTYEPMEGVVIDVQDHAQRTSTHGEMISSDLHGAEEPTQGPMDVKTPAMDRDRAERLC